LRFGRSLLGVIAGVMLGLGVVALTGSSLSPHIMQAASPMSTLDQSTGTSAESMATTNTSGASASVSGSGTINYASSPPTGGVATLYSHLNVVARQPIALTGFVLLPIFAAFLLGFILYKAFGVRNERDESAEAA